MSPPSFHVSPPSFHVSQVIELLLSAGADPNRLTGKDRAGFTALAEACGMDGGERAHCVKPLLRARADTSLEWRHPQQTDGVARTCRQWALLLNRQNIVGLLDEHDCFDGPPVPSFACSVRPTEHYVRLTLA